MRMPYSRHDHAILTPYSCHQCMPCTCCMLHGRLLVEYFEELLDRGGCQSWARLAVYIFKQVQARRLGQRRELLHLVKGV